MLTIVKSWKTPFDVGKIGEKRYSVYFGASQHAPCSLQSGLNLRVYRDGSLAYAYPYLPSEETTGEAKSLRWWEHTISVSTPVRHGAKISAASSCM